MGIEIAMLGIVSLGLAITWCAVAAIASKLDDIHIVLLDIRDELRKEG